MSDLILEQIAKPLLDLVKLGLFLVGDSADAIRPVSMHMTGAEREAVVKQSGIDDGALLSPIQQVAQVAQVAVAATDAITGLVLVQNEYLTRAEPAKTTELIVEPILERERLQ